MDNGFALQDKANGVYRIGAVFNEIGIAAIRGLDVRRMARPILEDLRAKTGETVSLSVLEGRDVRFVDCLEGTRSVRVGDRTGIALPANCTAGGKAILAALPASEVERRFPERVLPTQTDLSVGTWEGLVAELAEVRRTGYAVNREEGERGVSAVGACLTDVTAAPVAAIAIVVPSQRFTKATSNELAKLLVESIEAPAAGRRQDATDPSL